MILIADLLVCNSLIEDFVISITCIIIKLCKNIGLGLTLMVKTSRSSPEAFCHYPKKSVTKGGVIQRQGMNC